MLFKQKEQDQESNKSCYSSKESKINARKIFRMLGVWMVAKKLHPHPKTPNPNCRTKEKKIGYKNNTFGFLVKREELTSFDVFFV